VTGVTGKTKNRILFDKALHWQVEEFRVDKQMNCAP